MLVLVLVPLFLSSNLRIRIRIGKYVLGFRVGVMNFSLFFFFSFFFFCSVFRSGGDGMGDGEVSEWNR